MTDPIWRELREYAGRLRTEDLRPLAPGLAWKIIPKTQPLATQPLAQAQDGRAWSLPERNLTSGKQKSDSVPQKEGKAPLLSRESSVSGWQHGASVSSSERLMQPQFSGHGRHLQHTMMERVLRTVLYFLCSFMMDILFIVSSLIFMIMAFLMTTSKAILTPQQLWSQLSSRYFPLLSLSEWLLAFSGVFVIYILLFRLLAGTTLGKSVMRQKRF